MSLDIQDLPMGNTLSTILIETYQIKYVEQLNLLSEFEQNDKINYLDTMLPKTIKLYGSEEIQMKQLKTI
jgi:hypothetical protein